MRLLLESHPAVHPEMGFPDSPIHSERAWRPLPRIEAHCRLIHVLSSPIYMFDKEADTMRMLRSEDQNRGFDTKLVVL